MTAGAAALLAVLFSHLVGLEVSRVADAGDAVVIFASVRGTLVPGPAVRISRRISGLSQRVVHLLPLPRRR